MRSRSASLEFRLSLFEEGVYGLDVVVGEEGEAFGTALQTTFVEDHVQVPFLSK